VTQASPLTARALGGMVAPDPAKAVPDAPERRWAGHRRLVALQMEIEALRTENAALRAEVAELRPLVPRRPPKGWLGARQAAHVGHRAGSTIYKQVRNGKIVGAKFPGYGVRIDPASLV
jgi:hypothetical protein